MQNDPEIIDIPDDDPVIPASAGREVKGVEGSSTVEEHPPLMVIEREPEGAPSPRRGWRVAVLLGAVALALLIGVAAWLLRGSHTPYLPSGMSEDENIQLLDAPFTPQARGVETLVDTVLGVPFELYPLDGLRASLEYEMPDTADCSLVAFFRSADYDTDSVAIAPLVVNGVQMPHKDHSPRLAYVGISPDGRVVVGAGKGDKVMHHLRDNGGSFFRQHLLLADNTLPEKYPLHGKVERAALGRMADGRLYYVTSLDRETMWGFADALREYGFVDAAYITGGSAYDFRRPSSLATTTASTTASTTPTTPSISATSPATPVISASLRAKYASTPAGTRRPVPYLVFRSTMQ